MLVGAAVVGTGAAVAGRFAAVRGVAATGLSALGGPFTATAVGGALTVAGIAMVYE